MRNKFLFKILTIAILITVSSIVLTFNPAIGQINESPLTNLTSSSSADSPAESSADSPAESSADSPAESSADSPAESSADSNMEVMTIVGVVIAILGVIIAIMAWLKPKVPTSNNSNSKLLGLKKEFEELCYKIIKSGEIEINLEKDEVKNELKTMLKKIEEFSELNSYTIAIKILLESEKDLLVNLRNKEDEEIRQELKPANKLKPYRDLILALSFEKIGIKEIKTEIQKATVIGPDTTNINSHFLDKIDTINPVNEIKILTVNFTQWNDEDDIMHKIMEKSLKVKLLLMNPFVNDGILETIEDEYDAPVIKTIRWAHPRQLDIFRRLCQIYENLVFLANSELKEKIEVKLYKKLKPAIRGTLFEKGTDVEARIHPTPLMMAGDLYTPTMKITDNELWEKISNYYDIIWEDTSDAVKLDTNEIEKIFFKEVKIFYNWLPENYRTKENLEEIRDKIKIARPAQKQLYEYLEEIFQENYKTH